MSFFLSSAGATACLDEPYVALPTLSGVTICALRDFNENYGRTNKGSSQEINTLHPFNVVWSGNSAHLVIITADFICLYKCVALTSANGKFCWRWELCRSVDAPRNLLASHAGYSHPLLSLEQRTNTIEPKCNAGIGEVVVINLLCSLFQTFSIATPTLHPHLAHLSVHSTHFNRLSYSGRYLTTVQSFSGPNSTTSKLGIRVYDLLDLWVLETPAEASYLDFKYADLGVDSAYSISNSSSTVTDPLEWAVQQVQWKQSDRFTLAEDACELFFVANTVPIVRTTTTKDSKNRYSVGIADRHGDYSPGIESPYTPYTQHANATCSSTSSDVSVSIYSVSQEPDYENINILTMAYHAAIVAGQLNQADEYNTNTPYITGSIVPNSPHISSVEAMARTTTINLLVVVTLDALCREIITDYSYSTANTTAESADNRSVMFAWVEESATTSRGVSTHSTRKHKDSTNSTALWLSAVYSTRSTADKASISSGTSAQYTALLCGLQYDNRANSCNDQKQYSYSPSYVGSGGVSISVQAPFSALHNMRCVGNMGSIDRGSSEKCSIGVLVELYMVYGSTTNGDMHGCSDTSVLFSTLSLRVTPAVDAVVDGSSSTWSDCNNGRELSLSLYDYNTHVVTNTNTSTTAGTVIGVTDNTRNADRASGGAICTELLLPSASVRFTPVDKHSNKYTVTHFTSTTRSGRSVEVIDLSSDVKRIITAICNTNTTTTTGTNTLYILYTKADDTVHVGVWTAPSANTTSAAIRAQLLLHSAHYYAAQPTIHYTATSSVQNEYTTSIQPDPHFGLGIRIDVVAGKTVVSSFKRHPITNKMMSAQLVGSIAPGDEFVAINGKVLRGLALADVIHMIRTTVSEGGDAPVVLIMQKQVSASAAVASASASAGIGGSAGMGGSGSSGPSDGAGGIGTIGSIVDTRSAYSVKNDVLVHTGTGSPANLHEVLSTNSINSINSVLSTTSLTDGLDSSESQKYNNNTNGGVDGTTGSSGEARGSSVCVELSSVWQFQSECMLGENIVSADLCMHSTSSSGSSSDSSSEVYVVALQPADSTMSVVLYSVGDGSSVTLTQLSSSVYRSVYATATTDTTNDTQCAVQLWSNDGALKCSVLEHKVSDGDSSHATAHWGPVLTVYSINRDGTATVCGVYDCIPLVDALHIAQTLHTLQGVRTPYPLLTYPTDALTSTIVANDRHVSVQLRMYCASASTSVSSVPMYLLQDSTCDSTCDSSSGHYGSTLEVLMSVLQAYDTASSIQSTVSLLQTAAKSAGTDAVALIDVLLAQHASNTLITHLLQRLRAYYTLLPTNTGSTTADSLDALALSTSAKRAITLSVLLRSSGTATNANTNTTSTSSSSEASHSAEFILSGAAVANLLFSGNDSGSGGGNNNQSALLELLVPRPAGSTNSESSSTSIANTICVLLTTTTASTATSTYTSAGIVSTTSSSDTNDNTYLNFTATTNTNKTTATIDILAQLTSVHAALWLRDVTPLVEIIYKHAMAAFRVHKSSIQIFLEMVLIGKEDTLLQLAKTDRNKTGKQLLALLTLDDTFASDSARRKLQKNAFALMKLRRYRDAAAVFLLARPPFIKEACSVLCRQYNNVSMGLLVGRLAEMRASSTSSGVTGVTSTSGVGASGDKILTSVGVDGFVLGPVCRQLVESDLLPSFVAAVESTSLRSVQTAQLRAANNNTYNSTTNATTPLEFSSVAGINAVVLALVAALWLQDRAVLKSTLHGVLHRFSLVDCIAAASSGEQQESSATEQLLCVLASADWLLEVSAYLGRKHYEQTLRAVQEFAHQHHLHRSVLNTALYNTRAVRMFFAQSVRTNAFLQYSAQCYTQYAQYLLEQEKAKVEARDDGSVRLSLSSSANTLFTVSSAHPTTNSNKSADMGDDSSDYENVMKRISKFQLTSVTPTNTITTNTTNYVNDNPTTSTKAGAVGIADVASTAPDPVPSIPKSSGFNFASMSRPSAATVSTGGTGNVVSALDVFDMPPPPRRATTVTASTSNKPTCDSNNNNTSATANTNTSIISANPADTTIGTSSNTTSADPFAFDFAPPARHARAARAVIPAISRDVISSAEAQGGRTNDGFDVTSASFSDPIRHTRTAAHNVNTSTDSSTNFVAAADHSPGTSNTSAVTSSNDGTSGVSGASKGTSGMFNFAARPAATAATAPTAAIAAATSDNSSFVSTNYSGATSTSTSAVDPFAALDFAPPTRHVRTRPATATSSTTNNAKNSSSSVDSKSTTAEVSTAAPSTSGSADSNAVVDSQIICDTGVATAELAVDDLFSGMNISSPIAPPSFNFASNTASTTADPSGASADSAAAPAPAAARSALDEYDFGLFAPPPRPRRANNATGAEEGPK